MSVLTRNKMGKLFSLLYIFLIILSVFRYGSGTDYFAYKYHYYSLPSNIESVIHFDNNMEIGFNLLMYFFNKLNIPFEFFRFIINIHIVHIFINYK